MASPGTVQQAGRNGFTTKGPSGRSAQSVRAAAVLTVMSSRDTNHQQMSAVRSVQCPHLDQLHLIDVIVARSLAHKTSTV
jgi:hypothetical protein